MKFWAFLLFLPVVSGCAQRKFLSAPIAAAQQAAESSAKPGEGSKEPVVVTVEGRTFTAADLDKILAVLSPAQQQTYAKDRKEFVKQLARLMHLSQLAEKDKLDQQSPVKEQLELARMTMLSNVEINDRQHRMIVTDEERKQFFEAHKVDRYSRAKVKIIYVAFNPNPTAEPDSKGKKPLTEAEAKARAEEILKKIRAGGDFVKLVKEYSDDPISAAENGDFGPIKRSDDIDQQIKSAVFALKAGEVSEPVRQPNGFYIFRLEENVSEPFEGLKNQIFTELQNEKLRQWLSNTDNDLQIKYDDKSYFAPQASGTSAPDLQAAPAK
jgi:parvulin-like peptidyl-prolyl isomerase